MKQSIIMLLGMLFCLHFGTANGQQKTLNSRKIPLTPQCPVYSISPEELSAGSSAGQVYPTISVSTLNDCTNYDIYNSYNWMSYVQNGLDVTVSVTANTGYTQRSGCLIIGEECAYVVQACNLEPDDAGSISGESTVCQGQTGVEYSVSAITYATGYHWTLPSGATITSGANTNHITVSFSSSASSGDITVYGTNDCINGQGESSPSFSVTVNPAAVPPSSVTSTVERVCEGDVGSMTLTAYGGSGTTLKWYKGSCKTGEYLGSGNSKEVSVPDTPTSETYYATWTNDCGESQCASVTVYCDATPYVYITQDPEYAEYDYDDITLYSNVENGGAGNPTYEWTDPYYSTHYVQNLFVGTISQYDLLGPYTLIYTSAHGCESNQAWWNLNMISRKGSSNLENLKIYPNPTSGLVNISPNNFNNLEVIVYNSTGRLVYSGRNVSTVNLSGNIPGTYLMKVKSNGKEITRIINLKN